MNTYAKMELNTKYGTYDMYVWDNIQGKEEVALVTKNLDLNKKVMVRIHSECLTGDSFGSFTCDCSDQKEEALKQISKYGNGIFIYHRQEGRGMGLYKKVLAYNLLSQGYDTHEANIKLTGAPDMRDYGASIDVLKYLTENKPVEILLLTNNPDKTYTLRKNGFQVTSLPLIFEANKYNSNYQNTKEAKFMHNARTYKPYVSFTCSFSDIEGGSDEIFNSLGALNINQSGRKLFVGVPISDLGKFVKSPSGNKVLKDFLEMIKKIKETSIVLHIDFEKNLIFYSNIKKLISILGDKISLQIRFQNREELNNIDLNFIDSLRGENLIFQLRSNIGMNIQNQELVDYLRTTNTYLLIDDSFGTGSTSNFQTQKEIILKTLNNDINHIAVARGFSSENISQFDLLEEFFRFPISIDAESKLRTLDKLDIIKLQKYLRHFFLNLNK